MNSPSSIAKTQQKSREGCSKIFFQSYLEPCRGSANSSGLTCDSGDPGSIPGRDMLSRGDLVEDRDDLGLVSLHRPCIIRIWRLFKSIWSAADCWKTRIRACKPSRIRISQIEANQRQSKRLRFCHSKKSPICRVLWRYRTRLFLWST